jgi:pimeloyl-ACP methyl ester carboxylesterase
VPTLLVIHGMFCTRWHTRPLAGELEQGLESSSAGAWRVRAPSLPGREETAARADELGLGDYVDFVKRTAASAHAESREPVALLGHSMGGLVCLLAAAALAEEEWLTHLCVLAGAPPAGVNGFTWANARAFLPALLRRAALAPPFGRRTYSSLFMNRQDVALRDRIHPRLVPEPSRVLREVALPALDRAGATRPRFAARPRFRSLVLSGAADRSTPPRVQERIAVLLPGARYRRLEGLDHYAFLEGAGHEAALAAVMDFFASAT